MVSLKPLEIKRTAEGILVSMPPCHCCKYLVQNVDRLRASTIYSFTSTPRPLDREGPAGRRGGGGGGRAQRAGQDRAGRAQRWVQPRGSINKQTNHRMFQTLYDCHCDDCDYGYDYDDDTDDDC